MKDVFLVYNHSCFYEIVILNYFMNFTNCDMIFCSLDGKPVKAMEGFSVNVDFAIEVAKKLNLFVSEDDLQETIDFWKNYNRVQ